MGKVTISLNHDDWIEYLILCKRKGDYASNRINEFIKKELIKASKEVKKNEPQPTESSNQEDKPSSDVLLEQGGQAQTKETVPEVRKEC